MPRRSGFLILGGGDGKARVLFGSAAARERRKLAAEIDRTIGRALRGDLADTEIGHLEQLARLADRLARGGA
jgi:hypothetical protein